MLVSEIEEEVTTNVADLSIGDSQDRELFPMDLKLPAHSHPLFFEDTVTPVPETVCQLSQEIENGSTEFPSLSADIGKTNYFHQTDYWIALRDFVDGFESTLGEEVEKDHQEALQNSIKRWSSRGSIDHII